MNRSLLIPISLLVGVLLGFCLAKQKEKSYIYVDVDKVISVIAIKCKDVPTAELGQKIEQMKKRFTQALNDYEKTNNVVIFSSPKPIKGATDKTDYFIEQIR